MKREKQSKKKSYEKHLTKGTKDNYNIRKLKIIKRNKRKKKVCAILTKIGDFLSYSLINEKINGCLDNFFIFELKIVYLYNFILLVCKFYNII